MESLRFLKHNWQWKYLGKYSGNFRNIGEKTNGPSEIYSFYFSLLNSLNLGLTPGAKSNGHGGTWRECLKQRINFYISFSNVDFSCHD